MKQFLISISLFFYLSNCFSQPAQILIQDPDGLSGILLDYDWSDEFNADTLDNSFWNTTYPWQARWLIGSHEQQYIRAENISLGGGTLKLAMKKEPGNYKIQTWQPDSLVLTSENYSCSNLRYFTYTGAAISSKKNFMYGYYEVRFKININAISVPPFITNHVSGIWPAFWFRGNNKEGNGEYEIDVFELQTQCENLFYGSVGSTNPKISNSKSHALDFDYSNNFIKIGILWTPTRLIWIYYDDENQNYFMPTAKQRMLFAVDAALSIILSVAMGDIPINNSNYCSIQTGPSPLTDGALPITFELDYLRAFKFHSSSLSVFPNPFIDNINFNTTNFNYDAVKIYDVLGHLVFSSNQKVIKVDLSFLPNGVYVVFLSNYLEFKTAKIIKTN